MRTNDLFLTAAAASLMMLNSSLAPATVKWVSPVLNQTFRAVSSI